MLLINILLQQNEPWNKRGGLAREDILESNRRGERVAPGNRREREKAKLARKSPGAFLWAMAQGDIEELRVPGESRGQEFLSSKKRSCVENYFVLTGGPLWTTMR